jgi:hypothetical protein
VAQAALALRLRQPASLPVEGGAQLAQGAMGLSLLSFFFILAQLPGAARRAGAAAKQAA